MEKRWEFDKEHLKKIITSLSYVLRHDKLSKKDKEEIKNNIFFFKNALKGNYWKVQMEDIPDISLQTLKRDVLNKMKQDYDILGNDFINWVLNDCDNIFKQKKIKRAFIQKSVDEMMEESLLIYNQYLKDFYDKAKFIYEYPYPLIQEVNHKTKTSFCIYSNYLQLPFLVLVKNEGPHILAHELEHSIESMFHMDTPFYYKELGPILFETIVLDRLYIHQKKVAYYYHERIEESIFHIDMFSEYFSILLEFSKKDFDISTREFIETFMKIYYDNENFQPKQFIENVQIDILDPDKSLYLTYFLSFLKSIELREQIYDDKKHGICLLQNCLNNPLEPFSFNNKTIDYYQRYCKEIDEKQKLLIKK